MVASLQVNILQNAKLYQCPFFVLVSADLEDGPARHILRYQPGLPPVVERHRQVDEVVCKIKVAYHRGLKGLRPQGGDEALTVGIPQGYHLYKRCRKNLKWHLSNMTKLLLLLREGTE